MEPCELVPYSPKEDIDSAWEAAISPSDDRSLIGFIPAAIFGFICNVDNTLDGLFNGDIE